MSRWSSVGGVPLWILGVALYLVIAVGAMFREARGFASTLRLGTALWSLLAAGTFASTVLLCHAHFDARAVCGWCLANGVIMTAAFIAQTLFVNGAVADSPRCSLVLLSLPLVAALSAGGWYGASAFVASRERSRPRSYVLPSDAVLVRPTSPSLGTERAQVLVVVFYDFHCRVCTGRELAKVANDVRGRWQGTVRLVVRHFPVKNNPDALTAAVLAQWAHSQGRFWDFVSCFRPHRGVGLDRLVAELGEVGLHADDARRIRSGSKLQPDLFAVVNQDIADGELLGVEATPAWFVRYPDGRVSTASAGGITRLLSEIVGSTR